MQFFGTYNSSVVVRCFFLKNNFRSSLSAKKGNCDTIKDRDESKRLTFEHVHAEERVNIVAL